MEPELDSPAEEKTIYEFFLISVLLKGFISVVEVIGGAALFFVPSAIFLAWVTALIQLIPTTPPFSFISEHLLQEAAAYTSATAVFLALYLLSRGLVKVVLIVGLLKNQLWAYPLSLIVLAAFVLYQFFQIITQHSLLVVGITIFDLIVMYFIWREYRIVRAHRALGV